MVAGNTVAFQPKKVIFFFYIYNENSSDGRFFSILYNVFWIVAIHSQLRNIQAFYKHVLLYVLYYCRVFGYTQWPNTHETFHTSSSCRTIVLTS